VASSDDLLTISAFARRVGLTPSALRFYDDCGVLRPVRVDDGTGYRYYTAEQESRGRLLRDLRAVDLPLAEVRTVLDGPPAESARILQTHVRAAADKAAAARLAAARILDALPRAELSCAVTLAGPEFASAVRQCRPPGSAVGSGCGRRRCRAHRRPAGTGCRQGEPGRHRPVPVGGSPTAADRLAGRARPVVVPADELTALRAWSAAADVVELSVGDGVARVARDGEVRELSVLPGYPGYRTMMDGLPPTTSRAIVSRSRLLEQLSGLDRTVRSRYGRTRSSSARSRWTRSVRGHRCGWGSRRPCWRRPFRTASDPTCCWRSGRPTGRSWSGPPTRARSPPW
jgi:DNA-binding transcriptional MerR regulator